MAHNLDHQQYDRRKQRQRKERNVAPRVDTVGFDEIGRL
jgi:hypothetical protein